MVIVVLKEDKVDSRRPQKAYNPSLLKPLITLVFKSTKPIRGITTCI